MNPISKSRYMADSLHYDSKIQSHLHTAISCLDEWQHKELLERLIKYPIKQKMENKEFELYIQLMCEIVEYKNGLKEITIKDIAKILDEYTNAIKNK